ncbi:MAG: YkvA family protein, partial [Roseimicrobium sp.]
DDIDKKMSGAKAFKALLAQGRLLLSMIKDYFTGAYREVPYWAIGAGALALVYVLSPIDAIPDIIPGLGFVDDAAVLAFCLKLLESELSRYKEWKETREAEAEVQKA